MDTAKVFGVARAGVNIGRLIHTHTPQAKASAALSIRDATIISKSFLPTAAAELTAPPVVQPAMGRITSTATILWLLGLVLTLRPVSACSVDHTRRVIRRSIRQVQACYELSLLRRADHAGRLVLKLEISADGGVTQVGISEDEVGDPQLGVCVLDIASRWHFEVAALPRAVTYPFVFRPSSRLEILTDPRRRTDLHFCLDKARQLRPELVGAVTLHLEALRAGQTAVAVVTDLSVPDESLASCITAIAQRWQFAEYETPFSATRTIFFPATPDP